MKKFSNKKISFLLSLVLTFVVIIFPIHATAITSPPTQILVTFNDGTLAKTTLCTNDLSNKLSVVDSDFSIIPNITVAWNSGVATIQFQDGASNQIKPWKGSYYLVIAGVHYTELIPFKISNPTVNVKMTVSYIPDYASTVAFKGDKSITATNITIVSGLAPKSTPVMLQDSKGVIYLENSDENTGTYKFFVPTGTYGIGLVGRNDVTQGSDTSIFGSGSTTASSINYAGSGNTEDWYTIRTTVGQATGPIACPLSPATEATATLTPDPTVTKNASAPKIFGKVTGAANVSTISLNYFTRTGAVDPVAVLSKIVVPKTGDQTFSLSLPYPFNGSKMKLVYSNTPNNATINTSDFDFSNTKISMKVTPPIASTTYDKDIKLIISSASSDTTLKTFENKALINKPDYLLYSTTTTFAAVTTDSSITNVSNSSQGLIAISTNSKDTTGVAYYNNGSLTIKAGTLPKVVTSAYYFKVVSGKCWTGDTTSSTTYTITAPLAGATLRASVSKLGASDSSHTTLTITNADTANNNYYYEFTSAQVKALTTLEDFSQSKWTKLTSFTSNTAQVDGTGHTTDYLTVACSPKSGNPTYISIKLSATSFGSSQMPSTPNTNSGRTATPGSVPGSTKLIGTLTSGNSLSYLVSSAPVTTVSNGTDIRSTQYRLYNLGSDITDVAAGNYVAIIEADSAFKVVKFECITLTSSNINPLILNEDGTPFGFEAFALDALNSKVKGVSITSLGTPSKTASNAVAGNVLLTYGGSIDDKGTDFPTTFTLKTPGLSVIASVADKQGDNDPNHNALPSGSTIIIQVIDDNTIDPSTGTNKCLYYKVNVSVANPPGDPDALPGAATTSVYKGKITDMNAISGTPVTLKSNDVIIATTLTGMDGAYYFLVKNDDVNKKYTVSAGGGNTGYIPLTFTLDMNAYNGYVTNFDFYGKTAYSVSGRIIDANGNPIKDAIVNAFDSTKEHFASTTGAAYTDQNGDYTLWVFGTNAIINIAVQKTSADTFHFISNESITIDHANILGQNYQFIQ